MMMGLLVSLLFSCTEFRGKLAVNSEVTFKSKGKEVTLAEGEYQAKIKFVSKKTMKIEVAGEKIKIKFDERFRLPTNGSFSLPKEETTFSHDIDGTVDTRVERGTIRHRNELCEVLIPRVYCNRDRCRTVYDRIPGRRFVEYRDDLIEKVFSIDFSDAGQTMSNFNANSSHYNRIYLYQGGCSL